MQAIQRKRQAKKTVAEKRRELEEAKEEEAAALRIQALQRRKQANRDVEMKRLEKSMKSMFGHAVSEQHGGESMTNCKAILTACMDGSVKFIDPKFPPVQSSL